MMQENVRGELATNLEEISRYEFIRGAPSLRSSDASETRLDTSRRTCIGAEATSAEAKAHPGAQSRPTRSLP